MPKNPDVEKRGRGRPRVELGEALTVRLPPEMLAALDNARRKEAEIPTRPEMLRIAFAEWAKRKGFL
jgi:hypothetical protein